jgi:hypothetical protein
MEMLAGGFEDLSERCLSRFVDRATQNDGARARQPPQRSIGPVGAACEDIASLLTLVPGCWADLSHVQLSTKGCFRQYVESFLAG